MTTAGSGHLTHHPAWAHSGAETQAWREGEGGLQRWGRIDTVSSSAAGGGGSLTWESRISAGTRSPMARVTMSPGTSSRARMCFSFPSLMLYRDNEMVVVDLTLLLTLCGSYPHPSFGRYVVLGKWDSPCLDTRMDSGF